MPAWNRNMADIELLNKAIESFNSASATLTKYYGALEEKVGRLTEEVEHKKQLLNGILDSIDMGVVFFDRDSVIRLMNRAAEGLLNTESERVVGGTTLPAAIYDEAIAPENGKPFPALISRSDVRDGEGNSIGRVLIFKDITRLKELEAENERNGRLSAMGELVLKIAHEIRNPLGSIELFASLLSGDLKGTEHGDYANRISNSVRSLVNTLDNMLRFSRGITPKIEPCSLNELIAGICDEFRELFARDRIGIEVRADGEYRIPLDRMLFKQAVVNILLNSLQAIQDEGTIEIGISDHDAEDGVIEISIRDNGIGMDEETRARMFDPFFSTKDRGTGLGMSIAAGVIAAHKGNIGVKSEVGKGTEFVIALPYRKAGE